MTILEAALMRQSASVMIEADKLPKEFASVLRERPVRGSHLRITVEELEESDEQKLATLRAAIQKGRDEFSAGLAIDGETMFAELEAELFSEPVKK
ncbi:MAG: hypothetical protein HQL43_15060 [Alphaproteobacteria bacterium]|nr:hypothetical protein [Alphaproteobacteria bacterium]